MAAVTSFENTLYKFCQVVLWKYKKKSKEIVHVDIGAIRVTMQ